MFLINAPEHNTDGRELVDCATDRSVELGFNIYECPVRS